MGPKGLIGGAFLLGGLIFWGVGAYWVVDANHIALTGVATTGRIVGLESGGSEGGVARDYAFEDREGRTFGGQVTRFNNRSGLSRRKRGGDRVGDSIPVIYDPANPERSVADTFMGRWSPLLWMLVVVPQILIGLFLLRSDRREQIEDGWVSRRF